MTMPSDVDAHRHEYTIETLPGHTFTTWYDPGQRWVTTEVRDANGALAGATGGRITPTEEGA